MSCGESFADNIFDRLSQMETNLQSFPNPAFWGLAIFSLACCIWVSYRIVVDKRIRSAIPVLWLLVLGSLGGTVIVARSAAADETARLNSIFRPYVALLGNDLRSDNGVLKSQEELAGVIKHWITSVPDIHGIAVLSKPGADGAVGSWSGLEMRGGELEPISRPEHWEIPESMQGLIEGGGVGIGLVDERHRLPKMVKFAGAVEGGEAVVIHMRGSRWSKAIERAQTKVLIGGGLLVAVALLAVVFFLDLVTHNRLLTTSKSELTIQSERIREQMDLIAEKNQEMAESRSRLEEAYAKLHLLATVDSLTGVLNHRALMESLTSGIGNNRAVGSPCSIILLDIDNFKQLNDEYGHMAGDEALRVVGRVLKECSPVGSGVGRYGGEEFMVVLPGASESAAFEVAETIRRGIEAAPQQSRAVTASLGISTVYSMGKSEQTLINEADQAMYWAKRNGKNRTAHFGRIGSMSA